MPFLLQAPTIGVGTPLIVAVQTVGVAPKSASEICWAGGTCQ